MKKIPIIVILLYIIASCFSQKANYYKRVFIDAEYFLLYEEYREALPLYIEIYGVQQNNSNVACRIGECYLNIPSEKRKAIPFLEKASKDISDEYKIGYFSEKKAPPEAFYFLGIAYLIDNQIDRAIESFNKYKKYLAPYEKSKLDLANHQLKTCNNAKELINEPIEIEVTNLGKNINSSFANIKPVISANDSVILFTSQLRFYDAIFYSRWLAKKWIPASNITPYLGTDGDVQTCSLSPDGNLLFLSKYDWDNYNIYTSKRENYTWMDIEKFDKTINTNFNETHACITKDGNTIYFVSDREGGAGGKDIYKIKKDEEGLWSEAIILPDIINTKYDEETPIITEDGTLFFSSQGHYNMGGYDIFYAKKKGDTWETPKNIGYPLNTTDDDLNFMPINNGEAGYYSLFKREGFGSYDIYRIEF